MKSTRLLLMTSLCLATLAWAQHQSAPPQSEGQQSQPAGSVSGVLKALSERLNLTADQIAKIKPILQNQLTQMQAVRKDASLTAGQKLDKIRSIHDETRNKIRNVLTDDQKKKFDAVGTSEDENPPPPK
jgi:Spy/CpxP family protein refolding chaperone